MESEIVNYTRDRTGSGLGIKVLVEGISPTVDIVAIHGLDGHREGSWTTDNGILWLRDLLPQRLPHARIATYGYHVSTGSQSTKIDETLYGHAENFISRLALLRNNTTTTKRPIIFLAHSLGGIILKFALIHANQCNKSHLPYHKEIMLSTNGILFFGTPHQGTAVALSASQMLRVLLPVDENTIHKLLRNLGTNSEMLEIQLSQYNGISARFNTKFLYETYETGLHDGSQIVPKSSAIVPGARNTEAIGLNKSHMDMIKFYSAEDDDFIVVVSLLQSMKCDLKLELKYRRDTSRSSDILNKGPSYRAKLLSSPRFTGQVVYLEKLRTFFVDENVTTHRKHLLLYGMGGIGKTQISLKFAEQCADLKLWVISLLFLSIGGIFWLDATTAETLHTSFTEIAKLDPMMKSLGIEESGEAIIGWLAGLGRKCLLIFDNADGMTSLVSKYLPPACLLDVLITSRNPDLQQSVSSTLNLEVLSKDDAISLLMTSSIREGKTDVLKNDSLHVIAETLGFLPLALDVAGRAVYMGLCTVEEYTSTYLKNHDILLHGDHPWYKGASLYNKTICSTLDISYDYIEMKSGQGDIAKDALCLLKMMAFFHHQNIMEAIFKRAAEAGRSMDMHKAPNSNANAL
ncbi:P-loop containing nucleoside triphosphate hydrolase protein [Hysterangium stoloniferum]|nr:P-loop containing nucleoside triphosphate hydrolase protein [Hysterangium stoloniferum]